MMMTKLDQRQARALAAFIASIRPEWEPQGIYVALGKARDHGDAALVAIAAIRAAATPTNRTPAVIPLQGDHWTAQAPAQTASNSARAPRCTVYGHEAYPAHACAGCRTEQLINGTPGLPPASEPHGRDLAAGKD